MPSTPSIREKVLKVVEDLPREATIEDAMEKLFLLYKVEKGLRQVDSGETFTHDEARQRLGKWLE